MIDTSVFVSMERRGLDLEALQRAMTDPSEEVALAHDYGLLTEDAEHFDRVQGLTVLAPRWDQ